MNLDRMLSQMLRMFARRAANRGMRTGLDHMAGQGKSHKDMTPEERQRARAMKKQGQQAKRAMRMARRMGRF